jgi:hypothetical protein
MPWVLDGNNLAGGRDRDSVRAAALRLARSQRLRIVVFFDGAPPLGSSDVERLGSVEVRYAPNADAAITAMLSGGGAGWRLATDDTALARRARSYGAEVVRARTFWEKLDGADVSTGRTAPVDIEEEIAFFRSGREGVEVDRPRLVPRRRRRRTT